ncbi:MAG: glycosyltransferase family 4 protein, partial [Verrucomicrobiota bacterium]
VYRIGDALQDDFDVEYLLASTKEMMTLPLYKKIFWPVSLFHNEVIAQKLGRYQKIGRFDLWQVHNVFPAMSPVVYRKAFEWGVPIVHFLHNYRFGCTNGFFLNHGTPCEKCIQGNFLPALYRKSWRNSYVASGAMGAVLSYTRKLGVFDRVNRWIAISHAQKQKHVEMGIPADKIDVIYHFLEPDASPPPPAPNGYAMFIGRMSQEKGVSNLLDAWKILNRPDRQLVILGEGPELPGLRKKAELLGLRNVRFEGFKHASQQREIWAGAAFSIVPSIWLEPFGMVVLESWSKARPVVAHRIGALPELVEEGQTGFLADPTRPEDLAAAIARAFNSPEETAAMGQEGLARLQMQFTKKIWLEKMHQTYRTIFGK